MSDYLERWFRDTGRPLRAADRLARARQPDRPLRVAPRPPDRPVRCPPGHGADRRDDDRPVRRRDRGGRLYGRGACDIKGGMAAMLVAFARLVPRAARRARPRSSWPAPSTRNSPTPARRHLADDARRGRPGDRGRADAARTSSPATRGRCAGRSGREGVACHSSTPHLGSQRDLPDGRGGRDALAGYAERAVRRDARPDPRAAEPLGRPDRGGAERQRRPRLVRDRDRSPRDPRRGSRSTASSSVEALLRRAAGRGSTGSSSSPPGSTCPPSSPRRPARTDGSSAVRRAVAAATGRTPGRHGRPLRHRRRPARRQRAPLPRLRPGRHRPGPHEGRMDRAGPGAVGGRRLLPDRPSTWVT